MKRYALISFFLIAALSAFAQPFSPARQWYGAIIGHTDNNDYFLRADITLVQQDLFKGKFYLVNSQYSGEFVSDMRLQGNRLYLLNFQPVSEYPKPNPVLRQCFSGYFELSQIGSDSVRILDLYRDPVYFSTSRDYAEDSLTGELRPTFDCFSFVVLSNNQKDTALVRKEQVADSVLAVKKVKTDISSKRETVTGKQFQTADDSIEIQVWDNNVIDGDSISLRWNEDWIVTGQPLKKEKLILKIRLSGKQNELLLLAENLGKVPPNTAAITLIDRKGSKTFYLQSDFGKSEVLRVLMIDP